MGDRAGTSRPARHEAAPRGPSIQFDAGARFVHAMQVSERNRKDGMTIRLRTIPLAALCASAWLAPSLAAAQASEALTFSANLNLWVPTISGSTVFPPDDDGGSSIGANLDVIDDLKFVFMGSLEARKGAWGVLADVVYIDVGDSGSRTRSIAIGGTPLPGSVTASVDLDIAGWGWTLAGTYRVLSTPDVTFDVVAGARLLDIEQTIDWTLEGDVGSVALPDRAGRRSSSLSNWDAIVGVKGRIGFGPQRRWFVPYYVDVGTGNSDLTLQALGGLGYAFGWGDVVVAWRYLDYDMKSGQAIRSLTFNGPAVAAVFHW